MKITSLLCAAVLSVANSVVYAATSIVVELPKEICDNYVGDLTIFDNIFNKEKVAKADKVNAERNACLDRNAGRAVRIWSSTRDSCMGAIRKLSSAPSTLFFNPPPTFSYTPPYNYPSPDFYEKQVQITEGGYSVVVSGRNVDGPFRVMCYTDKKYAVTHIKNI